MKTSDNRQRRGSAIGFLAIASLIASWTCRAAAAPETSAARQLGEAVGNPEILRVAFQSDQAKRRVSKDSYAATKQLVKQKIDKTAPGTKLDLPSVNQSETPDGVRQAYRDFWEKNGGVPLVYKVEAAGQTAYLFTVDLYDDGTYVRLVDINGKTIGEGTQDPGGRGFSWEKPNS